MDGPGFESRLGQEIFLFSKTSRSAFGPPCVLFNGYRALLWWGGGCRGPVRDADLSPQTSAEVKNEWSYRLLLFLLYTCMAWTRDRFTCLYLYLYLYLYSVEYLATGCMNEETVFVSWLGQQNFIFSVSYKPALGPMRVFFPGYATR